jgi:hypothetical protein
VLGPHHGQRLSISVGNDKLDALQPAPPTPKMVIRGFNSLMSKLMLWAATWVQGGIDRQGPPGGAVAPTGGNGGRYSIAKII